MNAIEVDLRDFPADVQDLLRDRAVRERRPMGDVIRDYVTEVARQIAEVSGAVTNAGDQQQG